MAGRKKTAARRGTARNPASTPRPTPAAAEAAAPAAAEHRPPVPPLELHRPGQFEAAEYPAGQDGTAQFKTNHGDGTEEVELLKPGAESIDTPGMQEKVANLAFMAEPVEVMIHHDNDPQADPRVEVSVNGRSEVFIRGEKKTVQRMFVEGLARAKPSSYGNEHYTDEEGIRGVRHPQRTRQRYPFSVTMDRNPLGPSWLEAVLRQP